MFFNFFELLQFLIQIQIQLGMSKKSVPAGIRR